MATNNYFKVKNGLEFPSQDALQVTDTTGPSIRPSLLLDFANTRQLDPRVTFARASTGTFYDGKSVVKAEENLLMYSQEFDNAAWTKASSTVTANITAAPDGTSTADSVFEIATFGRHGLERGNTISSGVNHVFSIYIKPIDRTYVTLSINPTSDASAWAAAIFDMSTGTVASTNATSGLTVSASIVNAGNGWFRCILVGNAGSATGIYTFATSAIDGVTYPAGFRGTQSISGDSAKGFYAWGAQLEQRSTVTAYTPTTTAPITNYIPALQTATANLPRFDCDPVTGESKGLLIEEQRTNLLTYSSEFDNAVWGKTNATVTANTVIAPDGTLTGDKIISTSASGIHIFRQFASVTSAVTYTQSIYAKAAEYTWIQITTSTGFDGGGTTYRNINLSNGALGNGTLSVTTQSVGNGWYRLSLTATATSTQPQGRFNFSVLNADTASANPTYTGDGYSGLYIWGAQLEAGAFPTSYIPTVASQVTRSADAASMTGANFSSWYRTDEGTLYADCSIYTAPNNVAAPTIFSIEDGTSSNRIQLYRANNNANPYAGFVSVASGSVQANINAGFSQVQNSKLVGAYLLNNYATVLNAAAVQADTVALVPIVDKALIGNGTSLGVLNGTIKRIAYYPKRLSNTELQGITS